MAANDASVRTEAARTAGRARWTTADPGEALDARRKGAAGANGAAAAARRIVRLWLGLSKAEQAEVWRILSALRQPTNT